MSLINALIRPFFCFFLRSTDNGRDSVFDVGVMMVNLGVNERNLILTNSLICFEKGDYILIDCNLFAHDHGKFILLSVVICVENPTICFFVWCRKLLHHTFPRICHGFVVDMCDYGACMYAFGCVGG